MYLPLIVIHPFDESYMQSFDELFDYILLELQITLGPVFFLTKQYCICVGGERQIWEKKCCYDPKNDQKRRHINESARQKIEGASGVEENKCNELLMSPIHDASCFL